MSQDLTNFSTQRQNILNNPFALKEIEKELKRNGYEVLKGKRLKALKLALQAQNVPETDFGNIAKSPQPGIFDFRAFLNLAMLTNGVFEELLFAGDDKGVQGAG